MPAPAQPAANPNRIRTVKPLVVGGNQPTSGVIVKSIIRVTMLLAVSACATAARPQPGQRFAGTMPLQVTVRGSLYTGSALITPGAGDALTGTFTIAGPVEVKGTLTGHV